VGKPERLPVWVPIESLSVRAPFRNLWEPEDEGSPKVAAIAKDMTFRGFDPAFPIVVWRHRYGHADETTVIDGHTRLAAARSLGLSKVPVVDIGFMGHHQAIDYAIHCQRDRRSITPAAILRCVKAIDKRRRGRPAKNTATAAFSAPQTTAQTAASLGVSGDTVQRARVIAEHGSPDVQEAVESGGLSIAGAYEAVQAERRQAEPAQPVAIDSGGNEWYTPQEYIVAARCAMGGIDLDPASHPTANEKIGAATFYTAEDSGLAHEWHGRVWMYPPHAHPLIGQFSEKLAGEYRAGRVTAACVLVNNATDTAWFRALSSACSAACFIRGRVRFWSPGKVSAQPVQGQVVLYFGQDVPRFTEAFSQFGAVLRTPPAGPSSTSSAPEPDEEAEPDGGDRGELRCPFCGSGRVAVNDFPNPKDPSYYVACETCEAHGPAATAWITLDGRRRLPPGPYDTEALKRRAVDLWNRAPRQATPEGR
jgi:phage N-6-adenine-methyltransferase